MSLADLVAVSISASSQTPTRAGFGTPLILAAKVPAAFTQRARSYTSLAGMVSDGFLTTDPAYRIATVMFSQNPRVTRVKVGRRALPFTQVVRLIPAAPVSASTAETYAVTVDGLTAQFTSDATPTVAEVCTGLAAAINALTDADVDAIVATGGSTATLQTVTALDGVIGDDVMSPTRRLSMTFSSHANWDATTATITGTNSLGATITEDFVIPDGGNATVSGTKYFRSVVSISIPAQAGASGTFTVGVLASVTAVGSSGTYVACTAAVAGELHSYEFVTENVTLSDVTTDPGIATDLAAVFAYDPDWYGLALDSNSSLEAQAAAAWVEANKKLMTVQSADASTYDGSSITDLFYVLKAAAYARTGTYFVKSIGTNWLAAGILANRLPADPGSDTWKFKTPAGVSSYTLTDSQRTALLAKNANIFTVVGGIAITEDGKSAAGEYLDVTRFIDWLGARIQERVFYVLANTPKLPYTDASVDLIRGEVLAQLAEGIRVQGLAGDPAPTCTAPKVADVSTVDRAARFLPDIEFTGRLAGAIHSLEIAGALTV